MSCICATGARSYRACLPLGLLFGQIFAQQFDEVVGSCLQLLRLRLLIWVIWEQLNGEQREREMSDGPRVPPGGPWAPGGSNLVGEVEVRVHLDHLPAAVTVLVDANEQVGVVFLPPFDVKVSCLRMARNGVPGQNVAGAFKGTGPITLSSLAVKLALDKEAVLSI